MRRKFSQLRTTAKFISDPEFKIEVTQGILNIHLHSENQTLGCEKFYCVAHTQTHFKNCFKSTCALHLNFSWLHLHPHSHFLLPYMVSHLKAQRFSYLNMQLPVYFVKKKKIILQLFINFMSYFAKFIARIFEAELICNAQRLKWIHATFFHSSLDWFLFAIHLYVRYVRSTLKQGEKVRSQITHQKYAHTHLQCIHTLRSFPQALPHTHHTCGRAIICTCRAQPNVWSRHPV